MLKMKYFRIIPRFSHSTNVAPQNKPNNMGEIKSKTSIDYVLKKNGSSFLISVIKSRSRSSLVYEKKNRWRCNFWTTRSPDTRLVCTHTFLGVVVRFLPSKRRCSHVQVPNLACLFFWKIFATQIGEKIFGNFKPLIGWSQIWSKFARKPFEPCRTRFSLTC